MKKKTLVVITGSLLILAALVAYIWVTSTNPNAERIATSTTAATITASYQRKTFYTGGNHWVFYSDGFQISYTHSEDGVSWKTPTVIRDGASSSGLSVWLDKNLKVCYAYASGIGGYPVVYRTGSIAAGEIQWQPEQTVAAGIAGHEFYNGFCMVDGSGYPWVSYIEDYQGIHSAYVVKATSIDGTTWDNSTKIAELTSTPSFPRTSLLPLGNDEVYAIYPTETGIKGRLFSGKVWEHEEIIATVTLQQDFGYSAVSNGDNVHLTLLENQTHDILYFERTSQGWSQAVTLQGSQDSSSFPVLTVDETTHDLYCFWTYNNIIYLKEAVNGKWQTSLSTPFGQSFGPIRSVSSYYKVWDGKIGLAWVERPNVQVETFDLKYRFLETS
jgi:hypothetical protein